MKSGMVGMQVTLHTQKMLISCCCVFFLKGLSYVKHFEVY